MALSSPNMALSKGFEQIALKLQEQATSLSQSDISRRLNDALNDIGRASGNYCYLLDIFGDDESGDVVYSCGGDVYRCPYELTQVNGKQSCIIHTDQSEDVVPRTVYEPEADEDDHMAAMSEMDESAKKYAKTLNATERRMMLGERFISKDERDAAKSNDFAGSGKSFPILKPTDVMAAVRSIGRGVAGGQSAASLKTKIKSIATRKGWAKYLPSAWQTAAAPATESEVYQMNFTANLPLRESGASFCEDIVLKEASTSDYAVKLIQPGWGSSGYYSPELLKEDGPKIFTAGTQMFWNHATEAEERARPEGNLDNLAAVLTTNAYYDESGKQGAGLYARAKVFADYATAVAEKAPHTGLSIRALGQAKEGSAMGRKGNLITSLTKAESVDFVTKAGAGGKVLTESARPTNTKESVMDEAELKKLNESMAALNADNKKLRERMALSDAATEGRAILSTMRLDEAVSQRVLARCVARVPFTESGDLNVEEFKKAVEAEAKDEQAYISKITGGARVVGMGAPMQESVDPAKDAEEAHKSLKESFIAMGHSEKQAEIMAKGRVN